MNEILSGIKVIKLYGWELSFEKIVGKIRNDELSYLRKIGYYNMCSSFIWVCAPLIVSVVSFGTFVLIDKNNVLDANTAFVSLSLFNVLRFPLTVLPGVISALINANVSLSRIRNFLLRDENKTDDITYDDLPGVAVTVTDTNLGWDTKVANLKNLNIKINKGKLVAVVGQVGCGKSSLLAGILGEMHKLNDGKININGMTAYVAQQAWIQNATAKDNIIFDKKLENQKYDQVVSACSLSTDFQIMPAGDETEIGEKGINLSGGQKQRISLARAVYSNATNSLSFLPQVDEVIMLEKGEIVEKGSYEQLKNKQGAFAEFIKLYLLSQEHHQQEPSSADDNLDSKQQTPQVPIRKESIKASKTSDPSENKIKKVEEKAGEKIIVKEKIESGKVKLSVLQTYFKACGYLLTVSSVLAFSLVNVGSIGSNFWLSDWSNDANNKEKVQDDKFFRLAIYALLGFAQCKC